MLPRLTSPLGSTILAASSGGKSSKKTVFFTGSTGRVADPIMSIRIGGLIDVSFNDDKSQSSLRTPFHNPFDLGIIFIRSIGTPVRACSSDLRPETPAAGSSWISMVSFPHFTLVAYDDMVLSVYPMLILY